jgi:hypothetical protein
MATTQSSFSEDFLDNYLKFGLGSMPRADIDALVMHLLDQYGYYGCQPMAPLSNQNEAISLASAVHRPFPGKGVVDEDSL